MNEQDLFLAVVDLPPNERETALERACAGNPVLRQSVEALLRLDAEGSDFLTSTVVEQLAGARTDGDLPFLGPPGEPGSLGRLDHYETLEVVGRGGTGVVLRVRDTKLSRTVAVKVLAAPLAVSPAARERFAREARAAAAVRDEHVVAIHAVCDDAPIPYLVMEFVEGGSLETRLRRDGRPDVRDALRIGVRIARGLAAAHRVGLIHRDIKPANVLLGDGGNRVKLTDFGLARAADDAQLTESGLIAGTPMYMAPEQAAGEPIDARTDLFSLGSLLYELCTGLPAFRAPTMVAVIRRVCDGAPDPIRDQNPDVPEALCQLIGELHAKRPDDRPSSATEVAERLARILDGAAAPPTPTRPVRSARRPLGRRLGRSIGVRRGLAATVLLCLCVGLGLGEATGVTDARGVVVRLFAPDGTLVVEVDDPGVTVAVDGAELVITGAGVRELRLKPGPHQIAASRDGKVVRQELVTVARNGRQVVRISKESEPPSEAVPWERSVAALPAEQQVEAVARRLKERNPGFDGNVTPTVTNGVVTDLAFCVDHVEDLAPVRALTQLTSLECIGSSRNSGKLTDLSPLRGLRLQGLTCHSTRIADLSPLRGMPLKVLNTGQSAVSDLSPLRGMPLTVLTFQFAPVTDLSPLQGMPITWLDAAFAGGITDLRPVRGMPLTYLNVSSSKVTDLSPLAGVRSLNALVVDNVPVRDLSPLRELKLTSASFLRCPVEDLSPLAGMPFTVLRIDYRPDRAAFLRSFPNMTDINDKPVAAFWKEVGSANGP